MLYIPGIYSCHSPLCPLGPFIKGDHHMTNQFIPQHGGYKKLFSYQKAEIVYDATVYFCTRFLNKRDRTYDQMVQAARSGNKT